MATVSHLNSGTDDGRGLPVLSPRAPRLHWYEWAIVAAVASAIVGYLPIVIQRVSEHGFGDVLVFFRAGWAVWSGYPLFEVTDPHGWSYHYPPTFALAMGLFADPMPGFPKPAWSLPIGWSVAVWYLASAAAMLFALHVWARAIERSTALPRAQLEWNGWWSLRLGPLLALMPFIGDGFGRGQPTAVVLLSMVGFVALYAERRRHAAAAALAIGITIKIFPVVLLLIPLLRRDVATLAQTALWCAVFLLVVPALCLGPSATLALYSAMWSDHLQGIITGAPNAKIASEITFTSYDMLSVGAMLTRLAAGGLPASSALPGWAATAQLCVAGAFAAAVIVLGREKFWSARRHQPDDRGAILAAGALLCAALPILLSTSQPNYAALAAPSVALVQLEAWRTAGRVTVSPTLLCWSVLMWLGAIATEGGLGEPLRVLGPVTVLLLLLLLRGLAQMWQAPRYGFA